MRINPLESINNPLKSNKTPSKATDNGLKINLITYKICKFTLKNQFSTLMKPHFENDFTSYKILDGILHITYKQDLYIDLPAAMQIVQDRLALQEGQPLPILCDIRGVKLIEKSARNYLALEGSVLVSSVAFLVKSPVSKILFKFFLKSTKPPITIQSFEHLEEALAFLNQNKNNH